MGGERERGEREEGGGDLEIGRRLVGRREERGGEGGGEGEGEIEERGSLSLRRGGERGMEAGERGRILRLVL